MVLSLCSRHHATTLASWESWPILWSLPSSRLHLAPVSLHSLPLLRSTFPPNPHSECTEKEVLASRLSPLSANPIGEQGHPSSSPLRSPVKRQALSSEVLNICTTSLTDTDLRAGVFTLDRSPAFPGDPNVILLHVVSSPPVPILTSYHLHLLPRLFPVPTARRK